MVGDFIINSLRKMFFAIDSIVYGFIDDVYGLLLQLTRTSIFTQDTIHAFAERVYAVVGIFMLFKVSVSLINYVLNPEDFSNNEKGFGKIIKNVVISLALIVLVPYIFNEAYELQAIILEENTIMNLVFGSPSDREFNVANATYSETAGEKIQFTIMYAFAQPNYEEFSHDDNYDLIDCKKAYATDSKGNYLFRDKATFEGVDYGSSKESSYIYKLRESCWGVYDPDKDMYTDDGGTKGQLYLAFAKGVDTTAGDIIYQNYAQGVAQQSFSLFFRKNVMMAATTDGRYLVNYKFGISTAVGIGTLYLLLVFCIDIAVRSIKLGFLQMIAPIPILSYVDPKSGKDGMFNKWLTTCKNTYIELFTRLFALYFGIYVISLVGTFRDVTTGEVVDNWIVSIFMILGILIFVKQLPKIIEETLGFKGNGTFDIAKNPLKYLEDNAIGGKAISGAAKKTLGVAGGVGVGALANAAGLLTGQGIHNRTMLNAIKGGWNGDKFGKNFASSYGAGRERHKQLQQMALDGVSRGDVMYDKVYNALHGMSRTERAQAASEGYKSIQDTYKNYETTAAGVDAVAKEFDKRRKAAEAAGDFDEIQKWSKAFDKRIEQIAERHGQVVNSLGTLTMDQVVDNNGNLLKTAEQIATDVGRDNTSNNAALQNYAAQMESTAKALNASAVGSVPGATTIATDPTVNIKDIKNQAQSAQQSIDSNATNRQNQAVSKYSGRNNQ